MGAPFLPSSLLLPFLPLQVGIQVASEDLCSEKQWTVCKALATFVAHRELSKVGGYPHLLVVAGQDRGGEARGWWRGGGGDASGNSTRKLPPTVAGPQAPSLAPLPYISCVSHVGPFRSHHSLTCSIDQPPHPLCFCQRKGTGEIWRTKVKYQSTRRWEDGDREGTKTCNHPATPGVR